MENSSQSHSPDASPQPTPGSAVEKQMLDETEWWPVLMPEDPYDGAAAEDVYEVPTALMERYRAALSEWLAVQKALYKIHDGEQ